MSELSSYDALLYPLKALKDVEGIQMIPYFTGVFEQFEYSLVANETWDLESILSVSKEYSANTPVLELGCGSGRISLHLAKNGLETHSIDSSEDALERFRVKLKNLPEISNKIEIISGDILTYNFTNKYKLILLPNLTIHLFSNEESLVNLFRVVKSTLQGNGFFCFSIFEEPYIEKMGMYNGNTFCTPYLDDNGTKNIMWRTLKFNGGDNTLSLSCYMQPRDVSLNNIGYLSAHINKFWKLEEITKLINSQGWRIEKVLSDKVEDGGADGFGVQTVIIQSI